MLLRVHFIGVDYELVTFQIVAEKGRILCSKSSFFSVLSPTGDQLLLRVHFIGVDYVIKSPFHWS